MATPQEQLDEFIKFVHTKIDVLHKNFYNLNSDARFAVVVAGVLITLVVVIRILLFAFRPHTTIATTTKGASTPKRASRTASPRASPAHTASPARTRASPKLKKSSDTPEEESDKESEEEEPKKQTPVAKRGKQVKEEPVVTKSKATKAKKETPRKSPMQKHKKQQEVEDESEEDEEEEGEDEDIELEITDDSITDEEAEEEIVKTATVIKPVHSPFKKTTIVEEDDDSSLRLRKKPVLEIESIDPKTRYVVIKNISTAPIALDNWKIKNIKYQLAQKFPSVTLPPKSTFTFLPRKQGNPQKFTAYWQSGDHGEIGKDAEMWLYDPDGIVVHQLSLKK